MYVQSDALLLADVFENLKNKCLEICLFFTAPWLAWQAVLKKTKVKLDLLTNIDMLLIVQKSNKGRIYHAIMWQLITNTWKIMINIKIIISYL